MPAAGQYYLRTRAAADAIKFTVDQQALQRRKSERVSRLVSGALPGLLLQCRFFSAKGVVLFYSFPNPCWPQAHTHWRIHYNASSPLQGGASSQELLRELKENNTPGKARRPAVDVEQQMEREQQMAAMVCR